MFTIYSLLPEAFGCISGLCSSETDLFYLFTNHYQLLSIPRLSNFLLGHQYLMEPDASDSRLPRCIQVSSCNKNQMTLNANWHMELKSLPSIVNFSVGKRSNRKSPLQSQHRISKKLEGFHFVLIFTNVNQFSQDNDLRKKVYKTFV